MAALDALVGVEPQATEACCRLRWDREGLLQVLELSSAAESLFRTTLTECSSASSLWKESCSRDSSPPISERIALVSVRNASRLSRKCIAHEAFSSKPSSITCVLSLAAGFSMGSLLKYSSIALRSGGLGTRLLFSRGWFVSGLRRVAPQVTNHASMAFRS